MDDSKFDEFTRVLAGPSRRSLFAAMATAIGAALFGDDTNNEVLAKRTKRKRGRRKQAKRRPADSRDGLGAEGRKNKKRKKKKPAAVPPTGPGPSAPTPPPSPCGSCDDGIACTIDTCDEATATCRHTPDNGRCPPHWACDAQLGCFCPSPRQACGNVCVDTRTDPNHCGNCATRCQDQGAASCGMTGACVSGVCQRYPAGTVCQPGECIGESLARPARTCDANGACPASSQQDCAPYRCRDGACPPFGTGCSGSDGCISTHYCAPTPYGTGFCTPRKEDGAYCNRNVECLSGFCVGNVCCESACDTAAPPRAQRTCAGGTCAFTCDAGWGHCNNDLSDGCETDLTTITDCGECGNTCTCGNGLDPECHPGSNTYHCVCTG